MYDREKIRNITDGMDWVRPMVHNDMSDGQRRLAVTTLRNIATELDCLKPVNAIEGELTRVELDQPFPGRTDASLGHDHGAIPAAPGPDYATRKQLYAAIGTLNSTAMVDRNAVLALTDRVELIEKALTESEDITTRILDAAIGDACKPRPVNTIEPDQEWQRQHLYNQAYLAALPAVIKAGYQTTSCAGLVNQIATQSMEYLK